MRRSKMEILSPTRLETNRDISGELNFKLQKISEKNLPVAATLADYIALGVKNLEDKIRYADEAIKIYQTEKKHIKEQIERVKIEGAKFLIDNGIDRLDGVACSSVTVTKAKPEKINKTEKKEFVPLISEDEIEELLLSLGKAEMRSVVVEKISQATPAKLRINYKKSA